MLGHDVMRAGAGWHELCMSSANMLGHDVMRAGAG